MSLRSLRPQGDHELCKILLDFVNNHRPQLLGRNSGDILLLVRTLSSLLESSWNSV